MNESQTFVDRAFSWFKNNRLTAIVILLIVGITALGSFMESLTSITEFWQEHIAVEKEAEVSPEEKFSEFAKNFWQDRNRQIKHQKDLLNVEQEQIKYTEKIRYIYEYFFTILPVALSAYKKEREISYIEFDVPNLPTQNIFSSETRKYLSKIKFSKKQAWRISINEINGQGLPNISIRVGTETKNLGLFLPEAKALILIDLDKQVIRIERSGRLGWRISDISYETPITEYKKLFEDLLRTLIESQLSSEL